MLPQSNQEVKLSIADLYSPDPDKRTAARQEFYPLPFVDEQTGNCQRCEDNPPMRLYFRRTPIRPEPEHAYACRVAEICPICHRAPISGAVWITKDRAMAILRNMRGRS